VYDLKYIAASSSDCLKPNFNGGSGSHKNKGGDDLEINIH